MLKRAQRAAWYLCNATYVARLEQVSANQAANKGANAAPGNSLSGFGIHLGKMLFLSGTDVHWGDPVNTASKLGQDLASEGEILLSRPAYDVVSRDPQVRSRCVTGVTGVTDVRCDISRAAGAEQPTRGDIIRYTRYARYARTHTLHTLHTLRALRSDTRTHDPFPARAQFAKTKFERQMLKRSKVEFECFRL